MIICCLTVNIWFNKGNPTLLNWIGRIIIYGHYTCTTISMHLKAICPPLPDITKSKVPIKVDFIIKNIFTPQKKSGCCSFPNDEITIRSNMYFQWWKNLNFDQLIDIFCHVGKNCILCVWFWSEKEKFCHLYEDLHLAFCHLVKFCNFFNL